MSFMLPAEQGHIAQAPPMDPCARQRSGESNVRQALIRPASAHTASYRTHGVQRHQGRGTHTHTQTVTVICTCTHHSIIEATFVAILNDAGLLHIFIDITHYLHKTAITPSCDLPPTLSLTSLELLLCLFSQQSSSSTSGTSAEGAKSFASLFESLQLPEEVSHSLPACLYACLPLCLPACLPAFLRD